MADLQQIQTTYDLIAAAAAKVKSSVRSPSDARSSCIRSEADSPSTGLWQTPTSASPALSKLMEDHELAQSKLCGTARDTFSSASPLYAYPGHHVESFSMSPQSPHTPLIPHSHHHFSCHHHAPACYRHNATQFSSPASDACTQQFTHQSLHDTVNCWSHQVLEPAFPGTTSFSNTERSHNGFHTARDGHYQNRDQWQHPSDGQRVIPHDPPGHTPHDHPSHMHNRNTQDSMEGSEITPDTPLPSDRQEMSLVQPYATPSDMVTLNYLRQGLIGNHATFTTPFGRKRLVYADWAASGRLLAFTELFLTTEVAPWYANVHTDVGVCASHTSALLEEARECVARSVHAERCDYSVLFLGSGMTAAVFKLAHLLGLTEPSLSPTGRPVVMYSIMEHHSNCLLWRELDVETVVIQENAHGLPDLNQLERELQYHSSAGAPLILGSFSAGSNVTGISPDVHAIAALLHRYGAIAAFDFASASSCKHINCAGAGRSGSSTRTQRSRTHGCHALSQCSFPSQISAVGRSTFSDLMEDDSLDAVMLSPHKLPGGPGSCGVLVVKQSIVRSQRPQSPGGGTVRYVNQHNHWFEPDVERREEAGTPDTFGAVRAALALQLHTQLNPRITHSMPVAYALRAVRAWQHESSIQIVGSTRSAFWDEKSRLPLVSFNVVLPIVLEKSNGSSGFTCGTAAVGQHKALHPQFVAALLNDLFGIQARAGCACAGPYGQQLLKESLLAVCGCSQKSSLDDLDKLAASGSAWIKPGWVRVYFSYLMQPFEVDYIISAVLEVAKHGHKLLPLYKLDTETGIFRHRKSETCHGNAHKRLLQNTVQSWIQGNGSSTTDPASDHVKAPANQVLGVQPGIDNSQDGRHAEELLAQQLAEAQVVLSIRSSDPDHVDDTRSPQSGAAKNATSNRHTKSDSDSKCESCAVRWFLLPHESNKIHLDRSSTAHHESAQVTEPTAWRSRRTQRMNTSVAERPRGHSTSTYEKRLRGTSRTPGGSDDSMPLDNTSCPARSKLDRNLIPNQRDTKEDSVSHVGKGQEWACSREQRSRRDCFCPRCCAERVCGGLGPKTAEHQGYQRHQLTSSRRTKCIHGSSSSSDSCPPARRCTLRPESAPSKPVGATSSALQSRAAATDRASAALAAGRAALAQSIRRRRQREAVAGHKCRMG